MTAKVKRGVSRGCHVIVRKYEGSRMAGMPIETLSGSILSCFYGVRRYSLPRYVLVLGCSKLIHNPCADCRIVSRIAHCTDNG